MDEPVTDGIVDEPKTPAGGQDVASKLVFNSVRQFHNNRTLTLSNITDAVNVGMVERMLATTGFSASDIDIDNDKHTVKLVVESKEHYEIICDELKSCTLNDSPFDSQLSPSTNMLCIQYLPFTYTDEDLKQLVEGSLGQSAAANTVKCSIVRNQETGKSKGYGIAEYASTDALNKSKAALDEKKLQVTSLRCTVLETNICTYAALNSTVLYVDHIPQQYKNNAEFKQIFSKVGEPKFCQLAIKFSGACAGFAVVEYDTSSLAEESQQSLNGHRLGEFRIRVRFSGPGVSGETLMAELMKKVPSGGGGQQGAAANKKRVFTGVPARPPRSLPAAIQQAQRQQQQQQQTQQPAPITAPAPLHPPPPPLRPQQPPPQQQQHKQQSNMQTAMRALLSSVLQQQHQVRSQQQQQQPCMPQFRPTAPAPGGTAYQQQQREMLEKLQRQLHLMSSGGAARGPPPPMGRGGPAPPVRAGPGLMTPPPRGAPPSGGGQPSANLNMLLSNVRNTLTAYNQLVQQQPANKGMPPAAGGNNPVQQLLSVLRQHQQQQQQQQRGSAPGPGPLLARPGMAGPPTGANRAPFQPQPTSGGNANQLLMNMLSNMMVRNRPPGGAPGGGGLGMQARPPHQPQPNVMGKQQTFPNAAAGGMSAPNKIQLQNLLLSAMRQTQEATKTAMSNQQQQQQQGQGGGGGGSGGANKLGAQWLQQQQEEWANWSNWRQQQQQQGGGSGGPSAAGAGTNSTGGGTSNNTDTGGFTPEQEQLAEMAQRYSEWSNYMQQQQQEPQQQGAAAAAGASGEQQTAADQQAAYDSWVEWYNQYAAGSGDAADSKGAAGGSAADYSYLWYQQQQQQQAAGTGDQQQQQGDPWAAAWSSTGTGSGGGAGTGGAGSSSSSQQHLTEQNWHHMLQAYYSQTYGSVAPPPPVSAPPLPTASSSSMQAAAATLNMGVDSGAGEKRKSSNIGGEAGEDEDSGNKRAAYRVSY